MSDVKRFREHPRAGARMVEGCRNCRATGDSLPACLKCVEAVSCAVIGCCTGQSREGVTRPNRRPCSRFMCESKLTRPAPAQLLYRLEWFLKVRKAVESQKADWLILSALHGVVAPDAEIAPYEKTLNTAGVIGRGDSRHLAPDTLAEGLANLRSISDVTAFWPVFWSMACARSASAVACDRGLP